MKVIKIIFLLTVVYIFTALPSGAEEKKCSKWSLINPCPIFGEGGIFGQQSGSEETKTSEKTEAKTSEKTEAKTAEKTNSKSTIGGFFKKLRELGGKNIGEPG
tara:strand:- start:33 stop:341 length:309 start_codon:yes stop_codon:yes gene_type:complete